MKEKQQDFGFPEAEAKKQLLPEFQIREDFENKLKDFGFSHEETGRIKERDNKLEEIVDSIFNEDKERGEKKEFFPKDKELSRNFFGLAEMQYRSKDEKIDYRESAILILKIAFLLIKRGRRVDEKMIKAAEIMLSEEKLDENAKEVRKRQRDARPPLRFKRDPEEDESKKYTRWTGYI